MDANACGGLLPAHQDHLTTDRRSTPAEARWNDWHPGVSTNGHPGLLDVSEGRVLSDEEASLPESTGHCSDVDSELPAAEQYADDPSWFAANPDFQDYSGYAVSTSSPADNQAVLLECLRTNAVNINNGLTRSAIVFFDSGSNRTYISMKLARELQLPCLEKRYFRVNTFGTDVTTNISGFDTTVLLRSPQGATVALSLTASDRIVPPVTTATVDPDQTPYLLIGQDLVHLFDRRLGPRLPNGFQVVWSNLGPMVGGAGKVANNAKAARSTNTAAASDPEPPSVDTAIAPPSAADETPSVRNFGFNPEDPLNLWTLDLDDPVPDSAHNAGPDTDAPTQSPAHNAGSGRGEPVIEDASTHLCGMLENDDADLFGDFSHVENAGIGTSEMTPDDQAAADMTKKIHRRHPDGRYEVPLLFRTPDGEPPSNNELPTNISLAKGRSLSTRKMLVLHPKKMLDYHSVIMDWKERGFIKEAPKHTPHTKHALSHHPVFKETSTTTATRPVYDASAKLPGHTSLNDWLYRGPVSLPEVPAILLRSRLPKIVVLADISKVFLQMEVKDFHKDCLRFFWFRDPFKEPTDDNLIEYRFERVPFGLKSAPYLLAGVIKLHLESVGTPLALEMLHNCYVDNVLLTADTVDDALAKYSEAKKIFAQIGMPLREFASNSAEFNAAIDPADRADLAKLKELGIRWDILSDYWDIPLLPKQAPPAHNAGGQACLAASSATLENPAHNAGTLEPDTRTQRKHKGRKKKDDGTLTKRSMLRLVARIFDPQGLVQAATLLAELVIQAAWKAEMDWDTEITGELADLWHEAIKDFANTVIRVPRRIAKDKIKSAEIHVFTDGSSYAYGFTAYLRVKNTGGAYSTNVHHPAHGAARRSTRRTERCLPPQGTAHSDLATYLWSDSTIVLHQVANNEVIKEVWTENRLKEIRRLRDSLKIQFRHVPTDDNPADIVSRGIAAAELQGCEKWWHGAPFLAFDTTRWPEQPPTLRTKPSPYDQKSELYGSTTFTTLFLGPPRKRTRAQWIRQRSQRKKQNPLDTITEPLPSTRVYILAVMAMADAAHNAAKPPKLPSEPVLPREMEEKYDRWPRLVRIQYYVVRAVAACLRSLKRRLETKNKQRRHAPALGFDLDQCFTTLGRKPSLRDLQLVTMIIQRKTQLRHPPSVADRQNLGIFESQGLLYARGRLGNMKLRPTALTPLFLPREARETELIILEYHRINAHAGVAVTLANLRMRYWFTKGRSTIRNVLREYCFACRRESMQPYVVPPWPQLPTSRVTNARPFYFTGLDFFGPIYLRAPNGSGGYYTSKYYVCIFVCMTLRCIHLELCDDLSTDAFLHAFKRFGSRLEFPHRILSDNGLSFVTAREVIQRISGRHAHQQPVKRTLPVRKAVSARLAARRMPAPTASSAKGAQQQRPAHNAGAVQRPAHNAGAVLPPNATLTRDEEKFVDFCQRHNIEWQTITELSPWKGGVYERLIGLIKHCLRRSLGNTKPTVVEFNSLLLCAEHTANCRPLSYVANSDTDFYLVRPQDFLIPMLNHEAHQYPLDPATDDYNPDDPDFIGPGENKLHAKLMKDLSKGRRLADAFWQNFRDGALLELRNRGIDKKRRQLCEQVIQPGDLVLVSEKDVPRSDWRLALVLELLPHSDGLCRSARIRYASTKRETNRALEHLYPIGQIPRSTAACSTAVSRLGIYLSVLLSDTVSMSDISHSNSPDATSTTAALDSIVPISSATLDSIGQFALTDLTPPAVTTPVDPESPATDASVPAHNAGQNGPEPTIDTDERPPRLPSCSGLLFDPLELKIEHARQIRVAMNERLRIQDVLFEKFRRCLDLAAENRPIDRNLANLDAEMNRLLGTHPDGSLHRNPGARPPNRRHSTGTAERNWRDINISFWSKISISGIRAPDTNPFTLQPQPQPVTNTATPAKRAPARSIYASQSTAGSVAAHNAAPTPAVAQDSVVAHNAAPEPAPRAPANRPPFNSATLLRERPTFLEYPRFPSLEEIKRRVRQFFAIYPDDQEPPILEPIDEITLFSSPPEQTQKLTFVLNRTNPCPIPTTWDPIVCCDGDGEQVCFHCAIRQLRIIQATRWATGTLKKDAEFKLELQELLDSYVPSFGHMILLTNAVRLRSKDTNIRMILEFLTRMLASRDFDEDIPKLLAYYQPRMVVEGTRKFWPTEEDFRVAAKRWVCYCERAYQDIFERLSGPIIWSAQWVLSKDLPSNARKAFDKIATNAGTHLDVVRHMVYRHFGLKHVLSVLHNFEYEWEPFGHISDRDLLAEGDLLPLNKTIIFVDEYTLHYFGAALKEKVWMILLPTKSSATVIDKLLDKYPSREVQRIVFWFGTEYIVDSNNEDFGGLMGFLSHHFAEYFGHAEQFVIAPPYAQTHDVTWTGNVLGLLVQKNVMLPHARLAIDPHDLQLWRHQHHPTSTAVASTAWPSKHLTQNGRLRTPHVAEMRKHHLRKYHKLDLWTY
ncbi:Pao retrotransposon peptidase family protein-like protein [Aphelenchoides avenae]|nr:Pao retrotransposon peptidase family protein-like protein [Aphelenchus avenae]